MSNITNDTDAVEYLAAYVYTYGQAKSWSSSTQAELSGQILNAGTAWIDDYGDALSVVSSWAAYGLPEYAGFVSVAERIAEELGTPREGWSDWLSGYASGVAGDVAAVAETTRDIASGVGQSAAATAQGTAGSPWVIPAVVGGVIVGWLWLKR